MGASAAASFADIEVHGVEMGWEDHVAGAVGDAVGWVSCHKVEELSDGIVGGLCGGGLLLAEFAEDNKKFVVHSACVVEQSSNDCLDTCYAVLVKGWSVVSAGGVLYLRATDDGRVIVR